MGKYGSYIKKTHGTTQKQRISRLFNEVGIKYPFMFDRHNYVLFTNSLDKVVSAGLKEHSRLYRFSVDKYLYSRHLLLFLCRSQWVKATLFDLEVSIVHREGCAITFTVGLNGR